MRRFISPFASILALSLLASRGEAGELPKATHDFVEAHCLDCHDSQTARAGFRIDLLTADFAAGNNARQWKDVMEKINSGEMPPKKKARPDVKEAAAVTSWMAQQLDETSKAAFQAGGRVPMRRLNRVEYANTVRDMFSLDENFARRIEKELPADGKVAGFDRGAAGLFMDEGQLDRYLAVADLLLDEAVFVEKPEVQKFTWDAREQKFVHGIGACYRDEKGAIQDTNPPPNFVANLPEPLAKIPIDGFQQGNSKEWRYVPHGVFQWKIKGDGIEYLSGGNNYRSPGNLRSPFYAEEWGRKGVKRDGWYRFRVKAGAFAGAGKEAQKEVRLVVEYGYGSPIEVVKSAVIDAPLDAPKEYEFLMYLQAGPPGMNRTWRVGWDNGNKDVVMINPKYWDVQWKMVTIAGQIDRAITEKKPAEEIAKLRKQEEEATAVALENRKTFDEQYWVYDPKLEIENRPRLWVGPMSWEGPIVEWPPKGRQALFFAGEERQDDGYMREIFARLLPIAYRRAVTSQEIDGLVDWTKKTQAARNLTFTQAVREGVKNILCSPSFLYVGSESEVAKASAGASKAVPVDDWQLASRLSYLLWSSAPDAELTKLAAEGKLCDCDGVTLKAQVRRMIADPKADEFVRNFAGQWLGVRNFDTGNPTNRAIYRFYDDALRDSSKREPLEFFSTVLRENLPVTCFLDSDFLVINERLAKHYGIEGVEGENFRRVSAPVDDSRGGVLGMAGLMTYLADGTRTLPVRRATWVLDTLWNRPVPPPPPNVGDLPVIKGKRLTVRERLDQHRNTESCAGCHSHVDSFGMALENYDATGMWRDRQNGEGMNGDIHSPALDVSGNFPDGVGFSSVQEFKAALLAEKRRFIEAFTEKLLCYALGRPVGYADHITVDRIMDEAAKQDYRLQDIVQAVVASNYFQTR